MCYVLQSCSNVSDLCINYSKTHTVCTGLKYGYNVLNPKSKQWGLTYFIVLGIPFDYSKINHDLK